jgi:multidrug efflux pump subunit AcrB
MSHSDSLGLSGRLAKTFQNNALTPLLAIFGLLLGFFAIIVTPKEEEPQIDVTFANVFIAFPGASSEEVESLISTPAEQVLSEIKGVDDIYSVSRAGLSIITLVFDVGMAREDAILNLYNQVYSHNDWLPKHLGASQPLIKPQGIDDVPIMSLTLYSKDNTVTQRDLTQLAHALEVQLKQVSGTRDIYTQGEHQDVVTVELDPLRLKTFGLEMADIRRALQDSNLSSPAMNTVNHNRVVKFQAGNFLSSPQQISQLIVGIASDKNSPKAIYLEDVATINLQANVPNQQVFHFQKGLEHTRPAVTLAIAKQAGKNAFDITQTIEQRLKQLKNVLIPANIEVTVTRNYGNTAKDKSDKLMAKLLFATCAVVVLVLLSMSWREGVIVGGAIFITLAITLFASWAWGFTLNRISLFALIFSIGILVDDAIVVVENIHRNMKSHKDLLTVIPQAVDEVGGPTILATFTVIAALMPMAFVSGLMGPYMSPIPINASTGMLISLMVAFIITPWLAFKLLKKQHANHHYANFNQAPSSQDDHQNNRLSVLFNRLIRPLIEGTLQVRNRRLMLLLVITVMLLAVSLPVFKLVVMKMLPFDNKSELQIIVDMPEGTPMEETLAVLEELGRYLQAQPTVKDYQLYAGTHAPINFNGLVRQYYLRQAPHMGDIQVNLLEKSQRSQASHDIALQMRPDLQEIAKGYHANVKVVEVPPGPPVMYPIVGEVYGANYSQQIDTAQHIREKFSAGKDIIDVDDSIEAPQEKWQAIINRQKAALLAVPYASIVKALETALNGEDVSFLHSDQQKIAVPIRLQLPAGQRASLESVLQLNVKSLYGNLIPLSELLKINKTKIDQTRYHKNLKPVVYVFADMAGQLDSPLYGMFAISSQLRQEQVVTDQFFIKQPSVSLKPSVKWDGEWQVTYETFRDMGIAYGVGMILIYLLVVAQFKSYLVPLIIMAPIPLTIIGVLPGHALLNAQFTATSMIGMIALAGIIVRNSILLVDFINQQIATGTALVDACINSASVRAKPIMLTGLAAMTGAFFILDDPIFNGLAISLIFGILISTAFTLILIPMLYYVYKNKAP